MSLMPAALKRVKIFMRKIPLPPLVLVMVLLFPLLSCTYFKTGIHEYIALMIRTPKGKFVALSVLF